MPELDPQVKALLERMAALGRPPYHTLPPPQAREVYRQTRAPLQPAPPPMSRCWDFEVPQPTGAIPVRGYRPTGVSEADALPALVYFHGGGWTIGDRDTHDTLCRQLAAGARCAVLSVDYRLAPEHRFPAAVDDCIAATRWITQHAAELGVDGTRIAVGGDSAGGNLATVVAIAARDAGGPPLACQLLIYPATDQTLDHPSHERNGTGYLLTRESIAWFQQQYLNGPQDLRDWRASPLLAPDLSRLPPAVVVTAGFDPLRDEGVAYALKLAEHGVDVQLHEYPGMVHGFITMGGVLDRANVAIAQLCAALSTAFSR